MDNKGNGMLAKSIDDKLSQLEEANRKDREKTPRKKHPVMWLFSMLILIGILLGMMSRL